MKKLFGVLLFIFLSVNVSAYEYGCADEAASAVAYIEEMEGCLGDREYNYMYYLFYDFCENFH